MVMSHNALVLFELATADAWPAPWPMYRALRDHDPVHHVVPAKRPGHDYYVLSRHADVWAAARDPETFSSAQGLTVNYGDLEMIGLQDNPPFVMQDPPGTPSFANWCRAASRPDRWKRSSPRYASSSSSASSGCAPTAAATSSPSCSNRCRRWWSRITSVCPKKIGRNSTGGRMRSSRQTPPKEASPGRWKRSGVRSGR